MPSLEGTEIDTVTLPASFSFNIALAEVINGNIKVKDIMRKHIKKGITDICWKCAEQGWYIVGLQNATINGGDNTSWADKYTFTLGLRVRRFAESLRQEDVVYWAPQFCERIMFEFFQLSGFRFTSAKIKDEIATAMEKIATSTGTVDSIRQNETRQRIESETFKKLKKMFGDNEIKFLEQKIESPKWEIIRMGASDVEQPDSK